MTANLYIDLFNDKMSEFFKDLANTFPNVSEFQDTRTFINFTRTLNPKLPQITFNNDVVSKYKDAILNKNENFFLNHDYEIESVNIQNDYCQSFINQLKNLWQNMSKDNKDIIWKYLHILIVLNDKCIGV